MRFKTHGRQYGRKPVQPELVASGDDSRPVLTKIHLNAEKSEVWVTDSYMAARFPVDLDEGDTSGPIPVDALKAARKPPLKRAETKIVLNGNAEVLMDGKGGQDSAPYLTVPRGSGDYQFPNLGELFPDTLSEFEIGLDAARLYKLAKAMGSDAVRIRFTQGKAILGQDEPTYEPSNMRPMTVRPISAGDNDPTGLLMPIRIT